MERQQILALLPEILEIRSEKLRDQTVSAFQLAIKEGGWSDEDVLHAPVSISRENCDVGLIEHIRDVTQAVLRNYLFLDKYFVRHGKQIDRDILICGALTHDLGKFTEYAMESGRAVHGKTGNLLRHPLSGAILAAKAGLPDEVVHIVAVHSFEGDRSFRTAEADFIRDMDLFVFRCSTLGLSQK